MGVQVNETKSCLLFSCKKTEKTNLPIKLNEGWLLPTTDWGPKQIQWKQRFVVIIIPMKHWNCTVWIADKQNDSRISL